MIKKYLTLLLFACLCFIKSINAQSNANYSSPTSGTIDGIPFTFSSPETPNLFIATTDLSTSDFSGAPLSNSEDILNVSGKDWSITFDSPITNLVVYCKSWRTTVYEFDQPFIVLSGGPNFIALPNNQIQTTSFTDGVIQFTTPITTLNASVISGENSNSMHLGFGVLNNNTVLAPSGIVSQIYAGDDKTLANIELNGENIIWYDAEIAGNQLPASTLLTDEAIYYASQTVNGTESVERFAVTVNRISDANQSLDSNSTVANLVSTPRTGDTAAWFNTISGGTALNPTESLSNNLYYVEQITPEIITILGNGFNTPFETISQDDGKILVADTHNNAIKRMDADGTNIEILGSGFNGPAGIALQSDGKILIADFGNHAIKRMNADGTNIETLGSGFFTPTRVAVQEDGKIIVADHGNNAVKRMDANGTNIETLGSGFASPNGIEILPDGKILIADSANNVIKRMDADGTNIISLGSGLNFPIGIDLQLDGKILIADYGNSAIKRMDADGLNMISLSFGFNTPYSVMQQSNGEILIADSGNNTIKRLILRDISNRVQVSVSLTTEAPTALTTQIYAGDLATLNDLTINGNAIKWYDAFSEGNLLANTTLLSDETTYYASQTINDVESFERIAIIAKRIGDAIQTMDSNSTIADLITTPSTGATVAWFSTATEETALESTDVLIDASYFVEQHSALNVQTINDSDLSSPTATAIQSDGKILIANPGANNIIRMNPDGSNLEVLGNGFNQPHGIAVLANGKIIIADRNNNAIKKMDADGTNIVTLGGGFSQPLGVAVQADGKIVVADTYNDAVKRMDPDGSNIEVLGSGFAFPTDIAIQDDGKIVVTNWTDNTVKRMHTDGTNIETLGGGFFHPFGVTLQANGKIIIADTNNNAVKRMNADGSNIETLLNSGLLGNYGVSIDTNGDILISDSGNNALKRLVLEQISNRVPVIVSINTLGINDQELDLIKLYPNPAKYYITIKNLKGSVDYTIFDINGRALLHGTTSNNDLIDISSLSNGYYMFNIKDENITVKFIKK